MSGQAVPDILLAGCADCVTCVLGYQAGKIVGAEAHCGMEYGLIALEHDEKPASTAGQGWRLIPRKQQGEDGIEIQGQEEVSLVALIRITHQRSTSCTTSCSRLRQGWRRGVQ